jgi:hypothetical protein
VPLIKLWTTWADVDNSRRTRSGGPELSVRRAMLKLGGSPSARACREATTAGARANCTRRTARPRQFPYDVESATPRNQLILQTVPVLMGFPILMGSLMRQDARRTPKRAGSTEVRRSNRPGRAGPEPPGNQPARPASRLRLHPAAKSATYDFIHLTLIRSTFSTAATAVRSRTSAHRRYRPLRVPGHPAAPQPHG